MLAIANTIGRGQGSAGDPLVDVFHRLVDDRERAKAEEVEFDEPDLLDPLHVELGRDLVLGGLEERDVFGERLLGDHHAGSVLGRMPDLALKASGDLDQFGHARVLHQLLELRLLLDGFFQRDVECVRDELRDLVHLGIGDVQYPAYVPDHSLGHHRAVCDDLRYVVLAVLLDHVLEDFIAPVHAEVDVDIRHADTFGVQEPFEQEVVRQGIEVRDPETVGNEASCCRAAAGTHRNAVFLGIADEVPYDQEISGKAHLFEHNDLGFEPGPIHFLIEAAFAAHSLDLFEPFFQAFSR